MRFDLYDTKGQLRVIDCQVSLDEMRILISAFKTHCAEERSAYEFNHFVNWLKKQGTDVTQVSGTPKRVDM